MDIDRNKQQCGDALAKIQFCLDLLEKEGFTKGIDWRTDVTERLTMEEMIGALVHAEQTLKFYESMLEDME